MIVPPGHPWSRMERVPRNMLEGVLLLGGEQGTGTGRLLKQCLGEQADSMRVGMQLGSTEAVKRAVHAGLGISIVMASAVDEEHRIGWLRAIPIADMPLQKDLYVIRRDSGLPDNLPARFARFLQEHGHAMCAAEG